MFLVRTKLEELRYPRNRTFDVTSEISVENTEKWSKSNEIRKCCQNFPRLQKFIPAKSNFGHWLYLYRRRTNRLDD